MSQYIVPVNKDTKTQKRKKMSMKNKEIWEMKRKVQHNIGKYISSCDPQKKYEKNITTFKQKKS